MILKPFCSKRVKIAPIRLRFTASGLIIEKVLSVIISPYFNDFDNIKFAKVCTPIPVAPTAHKSLLDLR